jgi:Tfp pilus assembly protein PilF
MAQKYYIEALQLDPKHQVVRKNYATFLRDYPEARNRRNESVVDQTPLAKALSKRNFNSTKKTNTPKKVKTPLKNKSPTKYRPRRLEPELNRWNEK